MADTIPDISVTHTEYADVNTLSSIGVGSSMSIQNKEDSEFIIQVSASQPASSSKAGYILGPRKSAVVSSGENKVWAIGVGKLGIQGL